MVTAKIFRQPILRPTKAWVMPFAPGFDACATQSMDKDEVYNRSFFRCMKDGKTKRVAKGRLA